MEVKSEMSQIINRCVVDEYSNNFDYGSIIQVEHDKEGNISFLQVDSVKLNKLSSNLIINIQNKLNEMKEIKINIPIGYVTKNNLVAYYGPKISLKAEPLGYVEAKHVSYFEDAGINQTKHKVVVEVNCKVKIILPTHSNDINMKLEVPICESIIVGKVPNGIMRMDMKEGKINLNEEDNK